MVLTEAREIEAARLLALYYALELETLGFKRSGKQRSAAVQVRNATGLTYRRKGALLVAFDLWLKGHGIRK